MVARIATDLVVSVSVPPAISSRIIRLPSLGRNLRFHAATAAFRCRKISAQTRFDCSPKLFPCCCSVNATTPFNRLIHFARNPMQDKLLCMRKCVGRGNPYVAIALEHSGDRPAVGVLARTSVLSFNRIISASSRQFSNPSTVLLVKRIASGTSGIRRT